MGKRAGAVRPLRRKAGIDDAGPPAAPGDRVRRADGPHVGDRQKEGGGVSVWPFSGLMAVLAHKARPTYDELRRMDKCEARAPLRALSPHLALPLRKILPPLSF